MLDWNIENEYFSKGYKVIAGLDEAGRGPLAGEVYAAAVILPEGLVIDGLDDSKKLTGRKRDILYDKIIEEALSYCVAFSTVEEIDGTDILSASLHAMRRAVEGLSVKPDFLLVDGNITRGFTTDCAAVIGGDARSPNIAAASILAKVSRDRKCEEYDRLYPQYGFLKHKGYGTKEHCEAILKYGPCPLHRKLFLRKIIK